MNAEPDGEPRRARHAARAPLALAALALSAFYALAATAVPAASGAAPAPATYPPLGLVSQSRKDKVVTQRKSYNYAPAVVRDGTTYHMYWCGGVAGDYVLHQQSTGLDGPWQAQSLGFYGAASASSYDVSLSPTGAWFSFDAQQTCDPNVMKVNGTFYMYYGGLANPGAQTAIGVATSADGVHFVRANAGRPVVVAAKTNPAWAAQKLTYGAGQPSAFYLAPYAYLAFTDTTGAAANHANGAGQFVLRSRDPTFATGVQELTASGWKDRAPGQRTAEYSILESYGIDWSYDAASNSVLAVTDRVAGQATLVALDPVTFRTLAQGALPLDWREGPGLLSLADKTQPPRASCGVMDVAAFSAAGTSSDPYAWNAIQYSQGTVSMAGICGRKAAAAK